LSQSASPKSRFPCWQSFLLFLVFWEILSCRYVGLSSTFLSMWWSYDLFCSVNAVQ
jgi:hypothetical protein